MKYNRSNPLLLVIFAALGLVSSSQAAQTYLDSSGLNTWNATDLNWDAGAAWANTLTSDAIFAGTGETVAVGNINAQSLTFNSTGYSFSGGTITLGGTPAIVVNQNAAISSTLAGSAGLAVSGTGILTLTGANSYSGGTTIATGSTVNVGNGGTTGKLGSGALANSGTLTHSLVGSGTTINLGGSTNVTGLTGAGSSSFSASSINFSNVTGGVFSATTTGNQSYLTTSTNQGLVFTNGASTYNFTTSGGASITMKGDVGANSSPTGGGAIVNLNTSSGNGTINLDISVGRSNQFWNIGAINANAGTGAINWTGTYGEVRGGYSSQSTPITLTGAINMTSNFQAQTALTLTLNAAGTSTVSGNLLGTINLVKGGSQNLTLSGANTYSGTTTVNTGRLIVNAASNTNGTSIASGAFVELNNTSGTVRDYSNTTSFTGAGTLVKTGTGAVQWGLGAVTFNMSSGALIDVQNGTFVAAASANDVWTNNKADLNVASGAIFEGAEGSSLANGGIFVDALSGGGTIKVGYTLGGPYGNKITFGVDNGTGSFAGVLANSTTDGNYVKTGSGTQTLTGTSTATGSMTVSNGTLALGHASNTLADTMSVTVDGASSIISLGANNDTVGAVSLKNGASITGSGGTLTGSSFAVESGSISAKLAGAVNLTKTTAGTVTLSGANTYTGSTTVNQGRLIVGSTSNTNATSIASGATLELNKVTGTTSFGVTTNFTGAGTIVKTGAGGVTWFGAATFNMSSGALIDVQEGTFTAADNGNDIWTNNKSDLNVATGAIFNGAEAGSVANGGIFVDAITGGGRIEVGYSDGPSLPYANKLTFGVDNGSGTFSGVLANKEITDPDAHGSFTKTGSGTQTLTGVNTYTGTTSINSGTLKLDAGGSIDSSATIIVGNTIGSTAVLDVSTKSGGFTVGSAQVLQGSGSVNGALAVSGTLAPGNSIESLGSGAVTFNNTSTYAYEFNSSTITADLLYSSGALAIASGTELTFSDLGLNVALPNDTKFTLISYLDSSTNWTGGLFTLGSTTLLDDSIFTFGANQWVFNYNEMSGGTNYTGDQAGATRFVTMTVVPESSSILLGGLGVLSLLRRRRA